MCICIVIVLGIIAWGSTRLGEVMDAQVTQKIRGAAAVYWGRPRN